jgi:hypothetical protein
VLLPVTVRIPDQDDRVHVAYDSSSDLLDLGDGLRIHADVQVAVREWSHDVDLAIVVADGRLVADNVRVSRREGGDPVTSEALRSIPVARLVRAASGAVRHVREEYPGGGMSLGPAWPNEEEGAYVAKHGLDDDTLRIVARVYRVAYLLGDAPTKRVETLFNLPRSTASRWIATARQRGYLGESRGPGKTGG